MDLLISLHLFLFVFLPFPPPTPPPLFIYPLISSLLKLLLDISQHIHLF